MELLSRTGYGPIKQIKLEQSSVSTHFTSEDIDEIKRRAIENGYARVSPLNADLVVDAEIKETVETDAEDDSETG